MPRNAPVGIKVPLPDDVRREFRLLCLQQNTTMSQKAVELISDWVASQRNPSPAKDKGGKGD